MIKISKSLLIRQMMYLRSFKYQCLEIPWVIRSLNIWMIHIVAIYSEQVGVIINKHLSSRRQSQIWLYIHLLTWIALVIKVWHKIITWVNLILKGFQQLIQIRTKHKDVKKWEWEIAITKPMSNHLLTIT